MIEASRTNGSQSRHRTRFFFFLLYTILLFFLLNAYTCVCMCIQLARFMRTICSQGSRRGFLDVIVCKCVNMWICECLYVCFYLWSPLLWMKVPMRQVCVTRNIYCIYNGVCPRACRHLDVRKVRRVCLYVYLYIYIYIKIKKNSTLVNQSLSCMAWRSSSVALVTSWTCLIAWTSDLMWCCTVELDRLTEFPLPNFGRGMRTRWTSLNQVSIF